MLGVDGGAAAGGAAEPGELEAPSVKPAKLEAMTLFEGDPGVPVGRWLTFDVNVLASQPNFTARAVRPSRFGGWLGKKLQGSGFFRTQKVDGRWWLLDPEGYVFFAATICNVGQSQFGSGGPTADVLNRFGSEAAWAGQVTAQLDSFEFSALASDGKSLPEMRVLQALEAGGVPRPHTITWQLLADFGRDHGIRTRRDDLTDLDDSDPKYFIPSSPPVFHPDFESWVDGYVAAKVAAVKTDPWLIGYYTDNELPNQPTMLRDSLEISSDYASMQPNRQAAWDFYLARKGGSPSVDQIEADDQREFLRLVYERYFRITSEAIRRHDPNHLVLGFRMHKYALKVPVFMEAANQHVDAIGLNFYLNVAPTEAALSMWRKAADKPFIVSEFYAKGDDLGFDNTTGGGWLVRTQKDRGVFYQNFVLELLKSKMFVGWSWFKYQDLDKGSNKGIVGSDYTPYPDVVGSMQQLNSQLFEVTQALDL